MAQQPDDSPALNPEESNTVQQVVFKLLYYARKVDSTMLVVLNSIAVEQYRITKITEKNWFNY